ncbi:MAG: glycosyltransferase family 4 protein [Beijerinckiaceae bacterium]
MIAQGQQAEAFLPSRVVVINDDSVRSGGAAQIAINCAELIAARGIPVTFLTGDNADQSPLTESGVSVECLGGKHIMDGGRGSAALRGLYDPRTRAALERWIAANDDNRTVYHLHNWHKFLSPSVLAPLLARSNRLFLSIHDYFLVCPNGGYFDFQRGEPCERSPLSTSCIATACDKRHMVHKLWRVARTGVRRAVADFRETDSTVIAVHDGMIPYLARGGVDERAIKVLRNPVTPWSTTRLEAEKNRRAFFVGRLELDKGVDVLCRAATMSGTALSVIGDGPLFAELKASFPDVTFHGWQSREQVAGLVRNARVFVLPSRWRETFGLVALEAAMSGIPVVISNQALISGEIAEVGAGMPVDPGNEAALAALLTDLMHDDALIAGMSRAGFSHAGSLAHTPESWCDALLALYASRLAMAAPEVLPIPGSVPLLAALQ